MTNQHDESRTLQGAAFSHLKAHIASVEGPSAYSKRYRIEHCERVARICVQVAAASGVDPLLLETAGILHDIGKWDAAKPVDHGRAGALVARDFLHKVADEFGLTEANISEITQGIAMHTDGLWNQRPDHEGTGTNAAGRAYLRFDAEPSVLARSVGDCDNVDRFSAYRVADTLRYWDFMALERAQQIAKVEDYLESLAANWNYRCATEYCQQLWEHNLNLQQGYFERLLAELS